MGRMMGLRNFCIEPTLEGCTCALDPRCGGIIDTDPTCPEHGTYGRPEDTIDTHFHPVQARRRAVGTLMRGAI